MANVVRLHDLLRQGKEHILPQTPVSLYRYVEHLVEVAVLRKYGLKRVLEVGPGIYPVFEHFDPAEVEQATLVDYNQKVLDFCERKLADWKLGTILVDIEEERALAKLGRRWDYVVSNGILEHLRNDAQHVCDLYEVIEPGGVMACITVLHPALYNDWDRAVGHYRRYTPEGLLGLFHQFSAVQLIQTAALQELARPLFFGRIRHLLNNSIEENNRLFGDEVTQFSKPPYAPIFGLVRYLLPAYLAADWVKSSWFGAIALVVARK